MHLLLMQSGMHTRGHDMRDMTWLRCDHPGNHPETMILENDGVGDVAHTLHRAWHM